MIPSSSCRRSRQPERAANAAQRHRSYTTPRGTIDDGSIIVVTYAGRIAKVRETVAALAETKVASSDETYFIISPTFETTSKKYSWLNNIVAVGKIVSSKGGADGHASYAIYVVR